MSKVVGYIRVSTDKQDVTNQRHEIQEYAERNSIIIDEFLEIEISSRKSPTARKIQGLVDSLSQGDTIIVCELSRIGRSVGQVVTIIDNLIARKVKLITIKENIFLNGTGEKDIQTTVMVTMFSLFAELERALISQRTKQALAAKKAQGVVLGRPIGATGKSVLDDYRNKITELLAKNTNKSDIARQLNIPRTTLNDYIKYRIGDSANVC